MSDFFLSIVIPAYNAEEYIKRSLDSIYRQRSDDLEIVVVNDGSTDRTEEIVNCYIKEHENCHISMISIPNGGLANARNIGWRYAKGKYFINLDADDFLVDGIIDKLRKKEKEIDFDCCIYGFQDYDELTGKVCNRYSERFQYIKEVISGQEACIKKVSKEIWICQGSACYKKSILKDYNIYNLSGINQGEDFYFIMNFLSCSKYVVSIDCIGVSIAYRTNSMMHASFNTSHLQIFQAIDNLKERIASREFLSYREKLIKWIDIEFELERLAIAKRIINTNIFTNSLKIKRIINSNVPPYRRIDYQMLSIMKRIESFTFNHSIITYIFIVKLYYLIVKK